jgi:hypothetical protein
MSVGPVFHNHATRENCWQAGLYREKPKGLDERPIVFAMCAVAMEACVLEGLGQIGI